MAKLSDSILTNIFSLQRSIVESIDGTTALEFRIFERWGETAETLIELEELQNIKERLRNQHTRLNTLLLTTVRSQPFAERCASK